MDDDLRKYEKEKQYLVCIDSDGSVMDSMYKKHIEIFAPLAIKVWGLEELKDIFIKEWASINLYSSNRGVDRYRGLVFTFNSLSKQGYNLDDLLEIKHWIEKDEVSFQHNLLKKRETKNNINLEKILEWDKLVKEAVKNIKYDIFRNAKEAVSYVSNKADIAVISTAKKISLYKEWGEHGLLDKTKIILGQENGSKINSIKKLKEKGYDKKHIIFLGDSPLDIFSAQESEILYYPIIPQEEEYSWKRFFNIAFQKFMLGEFDKNYQRKLISEYWSKLS